MDTFPLDLSASPTEEALGAFLEGIQGKAESLGHGQLVSISIESKALDPLAVLESIYEPGELHFYMERRSDGLALAGAEEALALKAKEGNRFENAREFIEDTLANASAVGDSSLPFFGPHFFCGFTFFEEREEGSPFEPATVFVPKWQVSMVSGKCVATANAYIDGGSDIDSIKKRIWNANTKFNTFDYRPNGARQEEADRPKWHVEGDERGNSDDAFIEAVGQALTEIREGAFEKIVLARSKNFRANQEFHPLEILNGLREQYPDCYAFSFANGEGQSFIGASPERLAKLEGNVLKVDALAGSAPRGSTATEDARLGSQLLSSEKDQREHQVVVDSIRRRLHNLGIEAAISGRPVLKRLSNVQHLYNEISADVSENLDVVQLLKELHPSPAVGGSPRSAACQRIKHYENFDRGLYAGPIGWVNSSFEGEFLVGIRSALVDEDLASLYAGVGIVKGSVPENEAVETDLKFRALLESLL
ncbi:MAG TPA: isochorismate synthase [Opitutae bacterium]|nr:isochorismate synthase [Opitutaceae bacterium]HCR29158.1 isochorismate synthase [Opitutae bacterium]